MNIFYGFVLSTILIILTNITGNITKNGIKDSNRLIDKKPFTYIVPKIKKCIIAALNRIRLMVTQLECIFIPAIEYKWNTTNYWFFYYFCDCIYTVPVLMFIINEINVKTSFILWVSALVLKKINIFCNTGEPLTCSMLINKLTNWVQVHR